MKTIAKLSSLCIMAVLAIMISGNTMKAQENFSGKWAFNEEKSGVGQRQGQGQGQARGGFRMGASELSVSQEGNTLTVTRVRQGRDNQPVTTVEKYDLTGKTTEIQAGNNVRKATVSWSADKKVMTITSTSTMNMQGETREMVSKEVWKLAGGGKVLNIENINNTPNGEMKTTLHYDKK